MTNNLILQTLTIVLIFLSFFFAFFLLTVKSKDKTGNLLLSLYLILQSIDLSSFFYHDYIYVNPTLEMLRMEVSSFLCAPLLFLYVLSVLFSDFKIKTKHVLHLIPIFISSIVLLPNFYLLGFDKQIDFFHKYTETLEGIFSFLLSFSQNLGYLIATFILLKKYKKIILENYSFSDRTNYNWLLQMNIILSLLLGVVFIKNIYKFSIGGGAIVNYRIFMIISLLAFTCWLVLKAMYSSKIFRGIETKLQFVSSQKLKMKYENIEKKIDYLKKYMAMEEPFLNSEITIKELSNKLKLREQELSILINRYLDKNFYDFINDYRVNKAKEILKDPLNKKLTILEVLYQVGFNSKSSFNTIFKKQTGFTPTQFRKKQFE